jgi:hypothetical protein
MLHPFYVADRIWSWTGDEDFLSGSLASFFSVETPLELICFLLKAVDDTLFEPLPFLLGTGAMLAPVVGGEGEVQSSDVGKERSLFIDFMIQSNAILQASLWYGLLATSGFPVIVLLTVPMYGISSVSPW